MIETKIPNSRLNSEMRNQVSCAPMFPISNIWPNAEVASIDELGSKLYRDMKSDPARCEVLCVFMKARHEKHARKALARASFSEFASYALVPNPCFPRWLIPLENSRVASASLQLYNPQSLKGKGGKWIVGNLACFGILNVWGRDRLLIASKGNGKNTFLTSFLTDLLGADSISIALSTGTPGYYRKMTAQLMSKDGHTLAYAKIAFTQQARRMISQETRTLQLLAKLNISSGNFPGIIYAGQFRESELLVQSAPLAKTHRGPKELDRRHIEFLAEIFKQTSVLKPFSETEYWSRLKNDVDSLRDRVSGDWQRRLKDGLGICEFVLASKVMPLGLCHRDFAPWNTYLWSASKLAHSKLKPGHLYVFDWEYATEQGIPFWDIFHFASYPKIIVSHWSGKQLINYWKHGKLRRLLTQYAQNTGVDVTLIPVCFLLYLIEVSCFYLDMFTRDGLWNTQRQYSERTYAEILDELTMRWKEHDNWE